MEKRGDELDVTTIYRGLSSINRRLRGVDEVDYLR